MKIENAPDRLKLKREWDALKEEAPKLRIRDAARRLGVSEAGLLATGLGETVTLLEGDFRDLLAEVESLGYVMALTRNDHAVHERKGVYRQVSFEGKVGLALGEDIDLRLFMFAWKSGFAVREADRLSLQFFDRTGEAVHKIYLTEQSDRAAYDALVARYRAGDQDRSLDFETPEERLPDFTGLPEVEAASFRREWLDLQDTHEFFGLLKKYGLPRREALGYAPEGYAYRVSPGDLHTLFDDVSGSGLPIMVFVGSAGCIQIHTGPVRRLFTSGPWFNIMDPEFNLHLRDDAVKEAWVVRKPTTDGVVTAVELYDDRGGQIMQVFGKRKPGTPELDAWRLAVEKNLAAL